MLLKPADNTILKFFVSVELLNFLCQFLFISSFRHSCLLSDLVTPSIVLQIYRKNDELRKDAVDALCCLAHALGEDFTIFIASIHKLLLKYRLRV